ncbi:hypothetical protein CMI47_02380 [Candidatus Pacearchaeota archaeon]|nr:hypothetical protein [Candidatus Pacearchaeota archaeon]|tara:strand:- start:135 stop:680 length:546 start_codon:yes stop_codon:yes gene_type:complete
MIILLNDKLGSAIVVQKQHLNTVSMDTLKKYLSANPNEEHYCVYNIDRTNSDDLLSQIKSGVSSVKISRSKNSHEIYYRTAQNQIMIVDDMKGLIFNSSNDFKKRGDLLSKYGSLSKKFAKMLELGYLEELTHDEFIKIFNDIKNNNLKEEKIIINKSVSDYIDDLQDSGEPDSGATIIEL